jgi:asparagine synthase (glutamine-hydrolysing)
VSGIAGVVNLDGAPVDQALLSRMTRHLAAHGPDAQAVWIGGAVGLGHALLRTTWESASERQPHTLDGETWITADCRIDNRDDLLRRLARPGAGGDVPDPELILRAFGRWGEACLDHLLGDFAFAIWDAPRRRLFCARDHFGVKPFYYARADRVLVFGNNLNCVRLHPGVSCRLDDLAIADFLIFGYAVEASRSSFADVRRLPPGHVLTVAAGDVAVRRYWQLPWEDEIRYRRRDDYVEHFRELLAVATADRLRTDRVAVFMSGGLDSPTIAATAQRLLARRGRPFDLSAHTIVFDRVAPDEERRYSQLAADAIGIPIRHYPFDDYGFPPPEPEPEWYPPEPRSPFDRGRALAVHRAPAAQARVLLRGDGSDPLLDGPGLSGPAPFRPREVGRLVGDFCWIVARRRQLSRIGLRAALRKWVRGMPGQPYPGWLVPALERKLDLPGRWRAENAAEDARSGLGLAHGYWPAFFEAFDPGSMQLPAEMRYPFFDVRLVRYLLRVPAMPWTTEKTLLRVAMRGILPEPILRRRKAPLAGNPWAALLPPARSAWWEPYLAPAPGFEEFVDVEAARRSLARVVERAQRSGKHRDGDDLRTSLRPIGLNIWLAQMARARDGSG